MACLFGTILFMLVPESFAPLLLSRRAKQVRYDTGNWAVRASSDEKETNFAEIANRYLLNPMRMIVREPILLLMTLYLSLIYGECTHSQP